MLSPSPTDVYRGPFDEDAATRLLWRAGFGPKPGEAEQVATLGLEAAVESLTRPQGKEKLIGAAPHGVHHEKLDPINVWGDDHVWWLDRMVRTDQPLIERMTLIWHSWFATSEDASTAKLMLRQNRMMRSHALGNFHQLLLDVTVDPAMLLWLNGNSNNKYDPNENYGREMLELFTLGSGRGYNQEDVVQNARALTGWTNNWSDERGNYDFHFDPKLHDDGIKTIFGHKGRFNWKDSCDLAVHNREHASFFIGKLWSYFVGGALPKTTEHELEHAYRHGNFEVRPIVEAILRHPQFYEGPRLVTPPVVWCAGLMRATAQTITTTNWSWIGDISGQMLFQPPNVSGWDYQSWLDTSRWAGRLAAVDLVLDNHIVKGKTYPFGLKENSEESYQHAVNFWGGRELSSITQSHLVALGNRIAKGQNQSWEQVSFRQQRQNAFRNLIPMSADWMTA